jgi:hypothetical protein
MASFFSNRRVPNIVKKSRKSVTESTLYGLDKELAEREAAKFDVNLQNQAQQWIEELTGETFPEDFMPSLKNGVLLCKAINVIQPKSVKKIYTGSMKFKQMENVTAFIKSARKYGVPEYQLFNTVDLYEGKDRNAVISSIIALGGFAQSKGFAGPALGVAPTLKSRTSLHSKWEGHIGRNSAISKWNEGSRGAIGNESDAKTFVTGPMFGAFHSGTGDSKSISQQNMGMTGVGAERVAPVYAGREVVGNVAGQRASGTERRRPSVKGPPPPIPPPKKTVTILLKAMYDFAGKDKDEISLQEGDVIEAKELTADWTEGKNLRTSKVGLFPTAYVEEVSS